MSTARQHVIVGAGLAGHRAALELRKRTANDSITLLGAESHLPYDRPPLSKQFLLGKTNALGLTLAGAEHYKNVGIDYHPSTAVVAIERLQKRIRLADGSFVSYDTLLLATGSRPRNHSYQNSVQAQTLRTLDDAIRLRAALERGAHIAIIGGGFIGLEVAAVARQRGLEVTVIEASSDILSRGLPSTVGALIRQVHVEKGVVFHCGVSPTDVTLDRGFALVRMPDRNIEADTVVLATGIIPNTRLAEEADLKVDNGIVVDCHCRTSDSSIFAAGEVTAHPTGLRGEVRRLESWRVAMDQPIVAAACMTGDMIRYESLAWLWSDQYDYNLQVLGDVGPDSTLVYRGDLQGHRWTAIAIDHERRPVGTVALNNGRDISRMRRILADKGEIPKEWVPQLRPLTPNYAQAAQI